MTRTDNYPTRIEGEPEVFPRLEPVLHAVSNASAGPLPADQLAAFERDGFLFVESLYAAEEVDALTRELDRLRHEEEILKSEVAVTEPNSGEMRSIFAIHECSAIYRELVRDDRLVGVAEQILGSEVYVHQSRVNFKPGLRGKEFYWHSDFETWHAEDGMPGMRAVSCSIILTENHPYNGALMLIPGSHHYFCQCTGRTPRENHKRSLKRQEVGVPNDSQICWLTGQRGIEIPCGPPGSVLIFDCNVMHGSNGNITPYPRSNLFFVYNSVENTLEEPFAAETRRPWYLASRDFEAIAPARFTLDGTEQRLETV